MRRVLYITPSVRMLGARQSLLQIVAGFAASEGNDEGQVEPHVLVPQPGGLTERLDELGIGWTPLFLRPWRKAKGWIFIPGTLRKLEKLLLEREIDIIHCNEIFPTPYAVRAAERAGKKRGAHIPVMTHLRLERDAGFFTKYGVDRTDALIAVSDAVAAGVLRDCGEPVRQKLRTIPNAINIEEFRTSADSSAAERSALADLDRQIATITEHDGKPPFVLGQLGLLSQRKRHSDVLAALTRDELGGEGTPRILYVVVGDLGPRAHQDDFKHPKEEAQRLGLLSGDGTLPSRHTALFYPHQEQIAPFFKRTDAVVLPSEREGFGRVLIEAAVLGKPAIGADTGGIPSVISDGETGLLFPCGNVSTLANKLASLVRDPELRVRLGSAAQERAEQKFSLGSHLNALHQVYRDLLKPPHN